MIRTVLAAIVGVALLVPVVAVGEAVGFGFLAWTASIIGVVVVASLVNRDGFYGRDDRF